MATKKKRSVGRELVARLQRFSEELATAPVLERRFTSRTLRWNAVAPIYDAALVKQTRSALCSSQAVFAKFLGVSLSAVRDWEQGLKPPSGAACRLMDEIRENPPYFVERLKKLSTLSSAKPAG